MNELPSIFNDVIGPVMRGPSSSHTAASWRIARISLGILDDDLQSALVEFDREGAWAPNYREQGTCLGIEGGLLNLDITDEQIKHAEGLLSQRDINVNYQVSSFETDHANTVRLTLTGHSGIKVQILAVSLGGGSFEIRKINGFNVALNGDRYVLLVFSDETESLSLDLADHLPAGVEIGSQKFEDKILYVCESSTVIVPEMVKALNEMLPSSALIQINPIMPVIAGRQQELPFSSISSLLAFAEESKQDLGELGLMYEQCISGMSTDEVGQKMQELIQIIHGSIDIGLSGTYYEDRILQQQSHLVGQAERDGKIKSSIVNRIIANVSALMESKSSMEVVVAVPTAGSCGTVGGVLRAVSENLGSAQPEIEKAYFAAGIVGAFFAQGPGFSAEEHGCQVECGAAAGMAAAGIVQLMGGTAKQAIGAASMAIQNMIGLVCDPVADRVEVPCLGKNISAAVNAYSSAIMAISGYDHVIPLNQVINTVSRVSATMPTCVKCTGKGGLAITKTSYELKRKLEGQN